MSFEVSQDGGVPIKHWTRGVEFEDEARKQIINVSKLPFIHKHVALMSDCHMGYGTPVGSVVATSGAIVPSITGVDIGCGMMAMRTPLKASDLPDNLSELRTAIERAVPHGRTNHGGPGDRGAWGDVPQEVSGTLYATPNGPLTSLQFRYAVIATKHPGVAHKSVDRHCGTLGTGNHFIELCLDEDQNVWVMLHSGSRGPGNAIGSYFITKAKELMEKFFIKLPDKDLAYLPEGLPLFDDYVEAVSWAQDYARTNREAMMNAVGKQLRHYFPQQMALTMGFEAVVQCHHNYIEREHHFGTNVWVTRKGAVRARTTDLGIIPGSMGARSYIVRGLGNPDSFHSCSHGAGRRMSRGKAKKLFTLEDHAKATAGVECRKDADVIDETPGAYKSIDAVMEAQKDLVQVVHTLKQVLCVKG